MSPISRREFMIQTGVLLGASSVLPLLTACGSNSTTTTTASGLWTTQAEVEAAAKKEGAITYYTDAAATTKIWLDAFKADYPWVTTNVFAAFDDQLLAKFLAEIRANAPACDVFATYDFIGAIPTLKAANAIVAAKLPNDSLSNPGLIDPTNFAHPSFVLVPVIAYNTSLIPAPSSDLFDLANPKYNGKIVLHTPSSPASLTAYYMASRRKLWGDQKWTQWLQGLKANNVFFAPDEGTVYKQVQSGERAIGITTYKNVATAPKGAPTKGVIPDFAPLSNGKLTISSKAPNPHVAALFINWLYSPNGVKAVLQTGNTPPVNADSPLSLSNILPPGQTVQSGADLAGYNPSDFTPIFQQYWPS